jgi:hypothetical protein
MSDASLKIQFENFGTLDRPWPPPLCFLALAPKSHQIMPKPRSTLPIAHADDVSTIAFTDDEWQAIEHAYARQLNADVRQQITTVTTQYLKDCAFERTVAPKAIARGSVSSASRQLFA